jgi:hypothetical protein
MGWGINHDVLGREIEAASPRPNDQRGPDLCYSGGWQTSQICSGYAIFAIDTQRVSPVPDLGLSDGSQSVRYADRAAGSITRTSRFAS